MTTTMTDKAAPAVVVDEAAMFAYIHGHFASLSKQGKSIRELMSFYQLGKTQTHNYVSGQLYRSNGKKNVSEAVTRRVYESIVALNKPIETEMFKKISRIAQSARTQSAMMALMGYPVVGKTTCLKYLSMQHKNTYYVACTHLHSTEMLIEDIFAAFGFKPEKMAIRGGKRRRKAMLEEIAEAASYAESPLLILDDIHHLGIGIYQDLKVLFDATEGQLAILLVGTPTLEIQLKRWAGYSELNEKLRSKPRPVMWELLRRVKGHFYNLEGLSKDDLLVVLKAFGVADKRIAAYFINNPMLEMGMFTEKLRKGLEVSEKEQIPVTLELMQEI